jgi:hypothetical protein
MRTALVIALCMLGTAALAQFPVQRPTETEILEKQGDDAKIIINKAYSLLCQAQVFASNTVGAGGDTPSACWALTVIVKYDKEALARLTQRLMSTEEPVAKLYLLTAMFAVDPKTAERWPISYFPASLRGTSVHHLDACDYSTPNFQDLLNDIYQNGARRYLLTELPSIYQTIDVQRHASR